MDRQAVYDRVKAHLIEQGRKANSRFGTCCYRTDSGLKCAIGCLIPDDRYDQRLEGTAPTASRDDSGESGRGRDLRKLLMELLGADAKADMLFLKELQKAHDCAFTTASEMLDEDDKDPVFIESVTELLAGVATRHFLNP